MANELVAIDELKFDPNNARVHSPKNLQVIEESLQRNGFGRSVLLAKDGTILAGNATIEAAGQAGFDKVLVIETDGTEIIAVKRTDIDPEDPQAVGLAISDNAAATYADWHVTKLKELVDAGHDVQPYFLHDQLKALLSKANQVTEAEDRPTDLADEAITKEGDVWSLGDHYVMCGDSTDHDDVHRLMDVAGIQTAKLLVTSPPYGVGKDYADNSREDSLHNWRVMMRAWIAEWSIIADMAAINIADIRVGPDGREVHTYGELVQMCNDADWPYLSTRVWLKQPAWFVGPYYTSSYRAVDDYEFIGLFGTAPYVARLDDTYHWRYRGTWEMTSVAKNDDHPAKFPTELPERCIVMLTDPGDVVLDPFVGSGTTLIAAESMGRQCVAMELSPRYVDLTVRRWETMTGDTAVVVDSES
jgi:DNA modification methylase